MTRMSALVFPATTALAARFAAGAGDASRGEEAMITAGEDMAAAGVGVLVAAEH